MACATLLCARVQFHDSQHMGGDDEPLEVCDVMMCLVFTQRYGGGGVLWCMPCILHTLCSCVGAAAGDSGSLLEKAMCRGTGHV